MTIPNRTVTIKNVFAGNANTTIPTPPAVGVSYRNESTTAAEIGEGWPYKEVVDSAKFNQAMYEYTTICQQLEKYGFLPWSANTDYHAQGCALGSDGNVYQAKQDTGPSTTAMDPVYDTNHTYWDLFYYSSFTANRALISNANGKVTASAVTANELSYLSGVSSAIQTQINTKANNNAVVHLTGNESISGIKSFSNETRLKCVESAGEHGQLRLVTELYGMIFRNDGANTYIFPTAQNDPYGTWSSTDKGLSIGNSDGVVSVRGEYWKGPAISDMGKSKAQDDTAYNYIKLSNGLLIQWGKFQNTGTNNYALTFPHPFVNTFWRMITQDAGQISGYSYAGVTGIKDRTTTGCTLYSHYQSRYYDWIAIGYCC